MPYDEQGLEYSPIDVIRFGNAYDYITATTAGQRQYGAEYRDDFGSDFLNTFNADNPTYGYDPTTATTAAQRYFGAEAGPDDAYRAFAQDLREGQGADYQRAVGLVQAAGYSDADIANFRTNLLNDAGRTDAFSFLGDQLFPALTLFAAAAGGAAAYGAYAGTAGAGGAATAAAPEVLTAPAASSLAPEVAAGSAGVGTAGAGGAAVTGGAGAVTAGGASIPIDVGLGIPASIPAGIGAATVPTTAGGILGTGLTAGEIASVAGPAISGVTGLIGAGTQANAARDAASTQAEAGREANAFLERLINQQREDAAPFRQAGLAVLPELTQQALQGQSYPTYQPNAPLDPSAYAFAGPTAESLPQDPGFQFRLDEGRKLIERSAAARGTLNSGGTLRDLTTYGQGQASQEYQNAYNRGLTENQLRYERDNRQNTDEYGRGLSAYQTNFQTQNQLDTQDFNRLASVAGIGQVAQGNASALGTQTGQNIANNITSIGAANAAGQVGAANAYNSGLSALGGAAQNYLLYNLLQSRGVA